MPEIVSLRAKHYVRNDHVGAAVVFAFDWHNNRAATALGILDQTEFSDDGGFPGDDSVQRRRTKGFRENGVRLTESAPILGGNEI